MAIQIIEFKIYYTIIIKNQLMMLYIFKNIIHFMINNI